MYAVRCMENVFAVKTKISLWQVALMPETEFEALDEQKKKKKLLQCTNPKYFGKKFSQMDRKKNVDKMRNY